MSTQREVFVKVTAINGATKVINQIAEDLKRLQNYSTQSQGRKSATTTVFGDFNINDIKKYFAEVKNLTSREAQFFKIFYKSQNKLAEETAKQNTKVKQAELKDFELLERTKLRLVEINARQQAKVAEAEARRGAKQVKDAYSSAFKGGLIGGAIGSLIPSAAQIVGNIPQQIAAVFNKALNFDQSTMALSAITGGMDIAQKKIQELERVAAETPGLSFLSAVDGQKRLEAVGFEADKATSLLQNLSKVRILSGSTKQDYDAVIMNLTQIRAMGKLTGDELRETLGRMPYMARVVNDAFGTISTEKIKDLNISSDEFFTKLLASMQKVPTVAGGAGLAVENMMDAFDRLQIAIGRILEQNPDLIAMFRVIQDRLNEYTVALSDNESAQRNNFSSLTSQIAKGIISWEGYANMVAGALTDMQTGAKRLGLVFNSVFHVIGTSLDEFVFGTMGGALDWLTEKLDSVIKSLQLLPAAAKSSLGMDWIDAIPSLKTNASGGTDWRAKREEAYRKGLQDTAMFLNSDKWSSYEKARTNRSYELAQFTTYAQQERAEAERRRNTKYKQMDWKSGNGSAGGDSDSAKRSKLTEDSSLSQILDAMRRGTMQQESGGRLGIQNTRTKATGLFQLMPGNIPAWTKETFGQAMSVEEFRSSAEAQISVFNKYMGEYLEKAVKLAKGNKEKAIRMAASAWYGGEDDMLSFDSLKGGKGNEPSFRQYTTSVLKRTMQALRLGGKAEVDTDKINKELTQAAEDLRTDGIEKIFNLFRMTPNDDQTKRITDLRNRRRKDAGDIGEDVLPADVRAGFITNGQREAATTGSISTQFIDNRRTPGGNYLRQFRESLGLNDRFSQTENDVEVFYDEAVLREEQFAGIVEATFQARQKAQNTSIFNARVEWDLVQRRNVAEEVGIAFAESRNAQINELKDIERDLMLLRQQSTDDQFSSQRRLLAARREEYDLQKEIIDLQDRLANGGVNDGLRIQAALLNDIIDLRNREVDSIISANRSQLELSQSMRVSNNEIRAQVLGHLSSQETLSESIASGINQTYDALSNKLTETLDKLNEKNERFFCRSLSSPQKRFKRMH